MMPYSGPGRAVVLRGNAAHLPLPDESVDLIVTSPPSNPTVIEFFASQVALVQQRYCLGTTARRLPARRPDWQKRLWDEHAWLPSLTGAADERYGVSPNGLQHHVITLAQALGRFRDAHQRLTWNDFRYDKSPRARADKAAHLKSILGLCSLNAKVRQHSCKAAPGRRRADVPGVQCPSAFRARVTDGLIAGPDAVEKIHRLGFYLLNDYAGVVVGVLAVPDYARPITAATDADVPVRVYYASTVRDSYLIHARKDI